LFDRILIVCTGNVCRSPMAEALLSHRMRLLGRSASVSSAGVAALVGSPAAPLAITLVRERGLDLTSHRARQLTPELVRAAELVLVMEKAQERAVEEIAPAARGRVHRLGRLGGFDVPDPFRQGRDAFERSLGLIDRGLSDFEKAFWSGTP
jgi:protein-tyrosine phosphatase